MVAGHHVFVGQSSRTNDAGGDQFRALVEPFGYRVARVAVRACLHLKSAVTCLDERPLLANPD